MICNTVKPPFLVLVIVYAGFLMYQEVAFYELLFDVLLATGPNSRIRSGFGSA